MSAKVPRVPIRQPFRRELEERHRPKACIPASRHLPWARSQLGALWHLVKRVNVYKDPWEESNKLRLTAEYLCGNSATRVFLAPVPQDQVCTLCAVLLRSRPPQVWQEAGCVEGLLQEVWEEGHQNGHQDGHGL